MKESIVKNIATKRSKKSIRHGDRHFPRKKYQGEDSVLGVPSQASIEKLATIIVQVTTIIARCISSIDSFCDFFSSKYSLQFQVDIGTSTTTAKASTRPLPPLSNKDKDAHHGHHFYEGSMLFFVYLLLLD
jgi:hypothetical protein